MTVADFTFIVNKNTTTAMGSATSPSAKVEQAVYSVLQGVNSTKYSITIDGTTYSILLLQIQIVKQLEMDLNQLLVHHQVLQ